jgi:hypothetical protein
MTCPISFMLKHPFKWCCSAIFVVFMLLAFSQWTASPPRFSVNPVFRQFDIPAFTTLGQTHPVGGDLGMMTLTRYRYKTWPVYVLLKQSQAEPALYEKIKTILTETSHSQKLRNHLLGSVLYTATNPWFDDVKIDAEPDYVETQKGRFYPLLRLTASTTLAPQSRSYLFTLLETPYTGGKHTLFWVAVVYPAGAKLNPTIQHQRMKTALTAMINSQLNQARAVPYIKAMVAQQFFSPHAKAYLPLESVVALPLHDEKL